MKRPISHSLTPTQVETNIIHYKGIYILNNICNIAFGSHFIPCSKLNIIIMMILCLFSCLRAYEYLDYISYTFLVVMVITGILFIVPISIVMSSLYDISKDMTWNLKPHISRIMDKEAKRFLDRQLKSCGVIRCRVGNLYYMEAKAKLTTLDNIVNGIVFLMVNVKT